MTRPLESVLLGTAVGDSLGLPAEGLSPKCIARRWPGPWRQRFVFGRGMVSDDTEHTVFVALCLMGSATDSRVFQRKLASKLRLWLLCLPAGIGFATLRAIIKLWLGFPPTKSGVFSAGNGPAMRSAIIGGYFANDPKSLRDFVRASTRLTHTDPKAEVAALAVAQTAAWSMNSDSQPASNLEQIRELWQDAGLQDPEWMNLVNALFLAQEQGKSVAEFAAQLGLQRGITGYAYHSVPIALYSWLHHFGDFRKGLEAVLNCGGDTDTVGAIAGALAAIRSPIPSEWLDHLCDYPVSKSYLRQLGQALSGGSGSAVPAFPWPLLPFRNFFFLLCVLIHGFRRLLPI